MSKKEMKNILVIGASGQIGSELTKELRKRYGLNNVVVAGKRKPNESSLNAGPFEFIHG